MPRGRKEAGRGQAEAFGTRAGPAGGASAGTYTGTAYRRLDYP
jgi:hypothetical protein